MAVDCSDKQKNNTARGSAEELPALRVLAIKYLQTEEKSVLKTNYNHKTRQEITMRRRTPRMAPDAAMTIALAANGTITRQVRCTKRRCMPRKLALLLGICRHEMTVTREKRRGKNTMRHGGGHEKIRCSLSSREVFFTQVGVRLWEDCTTPCRLWVTRLEESRYPAVGRLHHTVG